MTLSHIDTAELLQSFGIALALGLLVGLEREWENNRVAGIRTFALITLFGALCGVLGQAFGGWVIAAALAAFASMVILGNLASLRGAAPDSGLTTEMAMLVMFASGIITVLGYRVGAVVIAGTVMVLLQSKKTLHGMVHRIGEEDLRAIARLVLIGLVILPALPNKPYGDFYQVLNPFVIWLMVVLIVGISLAAYLAAKFLGGSRGTTVAGILGGLVSSTATTISQSRRSATAGSHPQPMAVVTLIASAVVFLRVIIEVMLVAREAMSQLLPPLLCMMACMGLIAALSHRLLIRDAAQPQEHAPPSELKSAVAFGLLYALVLVAVAVAREKFGPTGLYAVAAMSGLTEMDAITLSTANLVKADAISSSTGWRVILVGGLANLVFKAGIVLTLGTRAFVKPVLLGFALAVLTGVAILTLWPA